MNSLFNLPLAISQQQELIDDFKTQCIYLDAFVKNCSNVIFILNQNFEVDICTDYAATFFGFKSDCELKGFHFENILKLRYEKNHIENFMRNCSEVLELKENIEYFDTITFKDSSVCRTHINIVRIVNLKKETRGIFISIDEDIEYPPNCKEYREDILDTESEFRLVDVEILLVDDNEINLLMLSEMLKSYGIESDTAISAVNAIEKTRNKKYDIIFMDHIMPTMNGVEAAQIIKNTNSLNSNTPIIAFTANSELGVKEMFLENSMNDYISKPIDPNELKNILIKWIPKSNIDIETKTRKSNLKHLSFFEKLESICDVNASSVVESLIGNEHVYISLMDTFINTLNGKISCLENCFAGNNTELYRIEMHSLKSSLANIGALELSESAKNLELSARNNTAHVNQNHVAFINSLRNLYNNLNDIFSQEGFKAFKTYVCKKGPKISIVNDRNKLEDLRNCLLALDTEGVEEILNDLNSTSYDVKGEDFMENINQLIDTFDYDAATLLINEILID